jgi:hypothetical protein
LAGKRGEKGFSHRLHRLTRIIENKLAEKRREKGIIEK